MEKFDFICFMCLIITLSFEISKTNCSYIHNVSNYSRPHKAEFVYKTHQDTIYCSPSTSIKFPTNIEAVKEIVEYAIKSGETVKAIGSRHSFNDIICTDGIPIAMQNINYTINNEDGTVTFGAGIQLTDALLYLDQRNKSLIQASVHGGVTIGGAVATETHGTSLLHPTSLSDQVVALTIIDGRGNIQKISNNHDLKAFRVHLGLLGIVIDVTLVTVPLFKMTVTNEVQPESILFNGKVLEWAETFDSFKIAWFPAKQEVVVTKGVFLTDVNVPGNVSCFTSGNSSPEETAQALQTSETLHFIKARDILIASQTTDELALHSKVNGTSPLYTEDGVTFANPATGFAWRLFTSRCSMCPWNNGNESMFSVDYSFAVNAPDLGAALQTIKNILNEFPAPFSSEGIFVRFSKHSDSIMTSSFGRATAHIEWITFVRVDPFQTAKVGLGAYQAMSQALIKEYNARPHWGKTAPIYYTQEVFKTSAPNRHKFIKAMKKFDPNGIFLNKFGRRLLGTSKKMDVDPRVSHCAIQDYCICAKDDDCAPLQKCSSIKVYPVCKASWESPSVDIIRNVLQNLSD